MAPLEDFAAAARSAGPDGIDFVKHVAVGPPVQMLAELFQVPASRHDDLFRWSNAIVAHLRGRPEDVAGLSEPLRSPEV